MLLWREKLPETWLPKIRANLAPVLVDHAHLERKAATSALNLEKYVELHERVSELNAIAIEELQHFDLVLGLLRARGIPFHNPQRSPWISGMMAAVRKGRKEQVIDHLVVLALIEGRSCEKFQILADGIRECNSTLWWSCGHAENETFPFWAYASFNKTGVAGEEDLVLSLSFKQADGRLDFTSDIARGDGEILADGPSGTTSLAVDVSTLREWIAERVRQGLAFIEGERELLVNELC